MALQDFLHYLTIEKRYSSHTVLAYQHDIESYLEYLHTTYEVDDAIFATSIMVRGWIVELVQGGLEAKSVRRKISAVKTFYKFLMKLGQLKVSPAHGVVLPKTKKLLPTFVEESKMDTLLDDVDFENNDFSGKRNKLIIELFYATGMRLSELINLKINDVDLRDNSIKVLGKGNKERIIPINLPTAATIKEYLAYRIESNESYLLLTDKGEQLYEKFVYRTVKKFLSMVSTHEKRSPHVLRHSFATHMLNNGADLNAIKELLGHANLAATQVYTHNSIEKLKKVYNQAHPRA